MATYLILAQSDATANAIEAWLELLGEKRTFDKNKQCIVWQEQSVGGGEKGGLAYQSLVRRIEDGAADATGFLPLNDVIVLVDAIRPLELNPLAEAGGWNSLIAMLILTFPEIHWVFGIGDADKFPKQDHSLPSLITRPKRDPLFDATGLRSFIRERISEQLTEKNLPIRRERAAAIDEETNYSLFHAYIAYRFGFQADAVRSWTLMEYLFNKERMENKGKGHAFHLLLEDVNLNFPDKPARIHLSTFEPYTHIEHGQSGRAEHCKLLGYEEPGESSSFRVIVSSGHSGADAEKMENNREYVRRNKPDGWGFVLKPVGGMFDLWEQSRLFSRLVPRKYDESTGKLRGQAPGFHWPPDASQEADESRGHSAPGKLMLIAQHLVRRADLLLNSANTVEECIRGAVLATDALELLRYQTPTLALQSLSLKHEFEVKAEVAFLGVGHHFALKPRLAELEREVKEASRFFQKGRRSAAELDTLVSIGNRLMLVFRNAGQFDEEQECLAMIRHWHRKLRFKQIRNPIDYIAQPIMAYAEYLLASPIRFILALFIWFLGFWGLWWAHAGWEPANLWSAASSSWNTFIAANPSTPNHMYEVLLNGVASAAGLFHLGVFIAYLYSAVSRK